MKIVKTNIQGWSKNSEGNYVTGEGYNLTSNQVQDQCNYLGVPTSLLNIDKSFGTNTTLDVLKAASNGKQKLHLNDDESEVLAVMDHRSTFMSDDKFDSMVDTYKKAGYEEVNMAISKGNIRATFNLPVSDKDNVLGDVFRKQIVMERMAQGGIYVSAGFLRLACTNGMLVADKEYRKLFRNAVKDTDVDGIFSLTAGSSVEEYFRKLFSNNGKWLEASVADYMGMRKTLSDIIGPDAASESFPTMAIEEHYLDQNIDINKISRQLQYRLPAGVTYFDAFNFMTHGVKKAEDLTLEQEISIGKWARPSYINQLRDTDVSFHGKPKFTQALIDHLKGDIA